MKTFGFTISLKDEDAKEKYVNFHKSVWPEVHDALDVIGVRSVQIFLEPGLKLFMHMETEDDFSPYESFAHAMTTHPRVQQWDDIMHGQLLSKLKENTGKTEWADMRKLYHYDRRKVEISQEYDQ